MVWKALTGWTDGQAGEHLVDRSLRQAVAIAEGCAPREGRV